MKKLFLILVLSLVLVFVGCGGGGSDVEEGEASTVVDVADVASHVTILDVDYPLYPGAKIHQKIDTFYTYIFSGDPEEVFSWYDAKMVEEGWTIAVEGSDGVTGQRTYQRGDSSDRTSLEFVIVGVSEHPDGVFLNIAPQLNRYRN